MTEKTFRTKLPLYGTCLKLVVCSDVAAFHKANMNDDAVPIAFTAWINGVLTVVIAPNATVGIIAHEVVHMAAEALEHHGVKWSAKNQEALTYPTNWIMDWVCKALERDQKKSQK